MHPFPHCSRASGRLSVRSALISAVATSVLLAAGAALAVPTVVPFVAELGSDTPASLPATINVDATLLNPAGVPVWGSTYLGVPVEAGVFRLQLGGDGSPPLDSSLLASDGMSLELTVNGAPLSPAFALGSVPYALLAETAENAQSLGGVAADLYATKPSAGASLHPVAFSGDYNDLENAPSGTGGSANLSGLPGRLAQFSSTTAAVSANASQDAFGRIYLGLTPAGTPNVMAGPNPSGPSHGFVDVLDPNGIRRARMESNPSVGGDVAVYTPTGLRAAHLGSQSGAGAVGIVSTADGSGVDRAIMAAATTGWGFATTLSPGGGTNVQVTTLGTNSSRGYISVDAGTVAPSPRVSMYADNNGSGFVNTLGPNGNLNTNCAPTPDNPNHGQVGVFDSFNNIRAGMQVNSTGIGIVFGDLKSFRMEHPTQEDKEIWYAAVEGPEAAAYVRGTSQMTDGRGRIELPEHFRLLANEETLTVTVTPLSADSKGLAVVHKGLDGVEIAELFQGRGSYEFDWQVTAKRKGFEDFQVVRDAMKMPTDAMALPAALPTAAPAP